MSSRWLIALAALVVVLSAALFLLREDSTNLPDGAVAASPGASYSYQQLADASQRLYERPLTPSNSSEIIFALAGSQAIIDIAAERGVKVSRREIARWGGGIPEGATASERRLWLTSSALLEKMARSEAGQVPVPGAGEVSSRARSLRQRSVVPEQRSYVEIETRAKSRALEAYQQLESGRNPSKVATELSQEPGVLADGGGRQMVYARDLSSAAARTVFSARQDIPTYPRRIDGRWRTYLVFSITPASTPPSLAQYERQVRRDLSQGVWESRVERAKQQIMEQARKRVACSKDFYSPSACGSKE